MNLIVVITVCSFIIMELFSLKNLSNKENNLICKDIKPYIEIEYREKNEKYSCEEIEKKYIKEECSSPFIREVERTYFEKEDNVCNPNKYKYNANNFYHIQKIANETSCKNAEKTFILSFYENPFKKETEEIFFKKNKNICNIENYRNKEIGEKILKKNKEIGSCILAEENYIKENKNNPYNELYKEKIEFSKNICDPRLYKDEAYSYIYDLSIKSKSCEKAEKLFIDRYKVSPFIFDKTTVKEIKIKNAIINNENKTTQTNVQAENAIINNNGGINNLNVNEK